MSLPKFTRKELYLSYLNGDTSVELPAPVTNEEHYLYELCMNKSQGGTGGVSSWNDLTDKPFYDDYVTILEETELELIENQGIAMAMISLPIEANAGDEFIVNHNGVDYRCVANADAIIGNSVMSGLEDTGEPFAVQILGSASVYLSLVGNVATTISIKKYRPATLERKYLSDFPVIDFAEIGLPTIGTNQVKVDFDKLEIIAPLLQKGFVLAKINIDGNCHDITNTTTFEAGTVYINMMVTRKTYSEGDGRIYEYWLRGWLGSHTIEIRVQRHTIYGIHVQTI